MCTNNSETNIWEQFLTRKHKNLRFRWEIKNNELLLHSRHRCASYIYTRSDGAGIYLVIEHNAINGLMYKINLFGQRKSAIIHIAFFNQHKEVVKTLSTLRYMGGEKHCDGSALVGFVQKHHLLAFEQESLLKEQISAIEITWLDVYPIGVPEIVCDCATERSKDQNALYDSCAPVCKATNDNLRSVLSSQIGMDFQIARFEKDADAVKVHKYMLLHVANEWATSTQQAESNSTETILPLFPTMLRPFSVAAVELFRRYLYFTQRFIERKPDMIVMLEFILILQYFHLQPSEIWYLSIEYVMKKIVVHQFHSFNLLWDVCIALTVLDRLHCVAALLVPQLAVYDTNNIEPAGLGDCLLQQIHLYKKGVQPALVICTTAEIVDDETE